MRPCNVTVATLGFLSSFHLLATAFGIATASEPNSSTWTNLREHLESREERFPCVSADFHSISHEWPQGARVPIVKSDRWKIQIEGDERVRVEQRGDAEPRVNSSGERITFAERVAVTDGTKHAELRPNFAGEYTAGFIDEKDGTHLQSSVALTPLVLCFRPHQWIQKMDAPVERNNIHVSKGVLNNTECVIASWSSRGVVTTAGFDPHRKYAPIFVNVVKGADKRELRWQLDYGDDLSAELPRGWEYASLRAGIPMREHSATVGEIAFDEIPDSMFSIDFPIHTFVMDRVKQQNYIVLEGGRTRIVKNEEWHGGKTFADILNNR